MFLREADKTYFLAAIRENKSLLTHEILLYNYIYLHIYPTQQHAACKQSQCAVGCVCKVV